MADSEKTPSKAPSKAQSKAPSKVPSKEALKEEKVDEPPAAAEPEPAKEAEVPSKAPSNAPSKVPSKNEEKPAEPEKPEIPEIPEIPEGMKDESGKRGSGGSIVLNLVQGRVDSYGQIHYGSNDAPPKPAVTKKQKFEKDYWICTGILFTFMAICVAGSFLFCYLGVQLFPKVNQTEPQPWIEINLTTTPPPYGSGGNQFTGKENPSGIVFVTGNGNFGKNVTADSSTTTEGAGTVVVEGAEETVTTSEETSTGVSQS